jgi:hypothetical protein
MIFSKSEISVFNANYYKIQVVWWYEFLLKKVYMQMS